MMLMQVKNVSLVENTYFHRASADEKGRSIQDFIHVLILHNSKRIIHTVYPTVSSVILRFPSVCRNQSDVIYWF